MKISDLRTVSFLKNFKNCVEETWKETDRQYHIPKSRFQIHGHPRQGFDSYPFRPDERIKRHRFRKFKSCVTSAWEASDTHYHIPKSRHGKATE